MFIKSSFCIFKSLHYHISFVCLGLFVMFLFNIMYSELFFLIIFYFPFIESKISFNNHHFSCFSFFSYDIFGFCHSSFPEPFEFLLDSKVLYLHLNVTEYVCLHMESLWSHCFKFLYFFIFHSLFEFNWGVVVVVVGVITPAVSVKVSFFDG